MHMPAKQPSSTTPQRIGELSVLPVFFNLKDQTVLIIGGTDAARWKAELLYAAGANLVLIAEQQLMEEEMSAWLASLGDDRVQIVDAHWKRANWPNAKLAIADVPDEEAPDLVAQAEAVGLLINVIDQPQFCAFQFGTIVNRSPVVVGISTNGAAPILGQAVRRRIETLLPQTLAAWGRFAEEVRPRVMAMWSAGPLRRSFWERLAERAFSGRAPDEKSFDDLTQRMAPDKGGRVTFVGAGPGDADYLTIGAVRALQSADVILFDHLVSGEVLELARREAKRTCVGKRGYRESCRQSDINDLMVRLALQGKHVVRLKGGDPSVFGRLPEEIAALTQHGIGYDVIPGITTGIALAARLGVSLTDRASAQSVRFVTAHSQQGGLPDDLDWSAMADPQATTVFYMSRATSSAIIDALIAHGLSPETPCAVGVGVARPDEQLWRGTLSSFADAQASFPADDPFVFAVGRVFETESRQALKLAG